MKLYYTPGACSLAPHIVLRETGLEHDLSKVDLETSLTADGEDYSKVNPKGYVPTLRLDDGQVLTEVAVIVQFLADARPQTGLVPPSGTMARYRVMEWLNFVSAEVHKAFGPLWDPSAGEAARDNAKQRLGQRFDYLAEILASQPYLMGDSFTVADAYLFTILNWTKLHGIDLGNWPPLTDYVARIAQRPAVTAALTAEGLMT